MKSRKRICKTACSIINKYSYLSIVPRNRDWQIAVFTTYGTPTKLFKGYKNLRLNEHTLIADKENKVSSV